MKKVEQAKPVMGKAPKTAKKPSGPMKPTQNMSKKTKVQKPSMRDCY